MSCSVYVFLNLLKIQNEVEDAELDAPSHSLGQKSFGCQRTRAA